ncbi:MAG: response regulator [Chloroflexi bacterium]|mgnify:CR=1 FL=1|nr:response regulator [Chloroflexota bacterium]
MERRKTSGKVLVIDDEDHIRNIVCRALKAEGYDTEGAPNGLEALKMLSAEHFDVILLDLKMPGMNGFEVLQNINIDYPALVTILMTGVADADAMKSAAADEGAFAVLTKPCPLQAIADTVGRAFNNKASSITEHSAGY